MRNRLIFIFLIAIPGGSCNKEDVWDGPNYWEDDFESYQTSDSLLDGENQLWSFFQLTKTENAISIDTLVKHSGTNSVKFVAAASDAVLSKCSIVKQHMAFWENNTAALEAWYYIEGNANIDWLFIMDFEENTPIGAGPGLRLAIVDDALVLNHKLDGGRNQKQPAGQEVIFPRDQWVHVKMEVYLTQKKKKGWVRIYQDSQLVLEELKVKTLPTDILYAVQGSKGQYSNIEFGITANAETDLIIYVDDVKAEVLP
jgi:hypothetical protein